ncbi:MAG: MFS transporter, partial [Verrucomicrobiota bacterium]
ASGWFGFGIAMFIFTIGEMISMPVQGAYVSQLAPEKMRGRFNGAIGTAWSGANIVGPVLGLWLLGYGFGTLCTVILCLSIGSAILMVHRHPMPPLKPIPSPTQSS